jgi:signal transduction histidine kinase
LTGSNSGYTVTGSADLLLVAFINLFENAYKFSKNKPVHVTVQQGLTHITVQVRDRGVGIPQAELEKVKEPFYRAGNVKPYSGHGIGLSLSQRIVKMHDGRLSITSEKEVGTTVTVELPRSQKTGTV